MGCTRCEKEFIPEIKIKKSIPYYVAEKGYIDEIIRPAQTKNKLIRALEMTQNNMPL